MQASMNLAPIFVALAIAIFVIAIRRRWFADFGLSVEQHVSWGTTEDLAAVSRPEYEGELRYFLEGKRGSGFSVSARAEGEPSITVVREGTGYEVVVTFLLPSEAGEMDAFNLRFAAEGRFPIGESGLNARRSVRVVELIYEGPSDIESLATLLDRMLVARFGAGVSSLYVSRYRP